MQIKYREASRLKYKIRGSVPFMVYMQSTELYLCFVINYCPLRNRKLSSSCFY